MTIQDTAVTTETLHRAVCTRCGYQGELRSDYHPAQKDRINHVTWHRDYDAALERVRVHLTILGFTVLDQNWRDEDGYTLPLAADDHGVLVAVDLRVNKKHHGQPLRKLSNGKRKVLRALAALWLREHGQRRDQIRVDVIGVLGDPAAGSCIIEHVRNV